MRQRPSGSTRLCQARRLAVPGRLYRIETKTHLDDDAWIPLGEALPAPSVSVSMTDSTPVMPQRFYRVVLAD